MTIHTETHSDHGTVIPETAAALVWDPADTDANPNTLSLLIPKLEEGDNAGSFIMLLAAVMIRARDEPEWIAEMVDWLKAHKP